MERVELEVAPAIAAGDAVTPTAGIFKGARFAVMSIKPDPEQAGPPLAMIRIDPPAEGGPAPISAPVDELVHFFRPGDCPVCGDPAHQRCEAAPPFPKVGWRVRLLEPLVFWEEDPMGLPAGARGTVYSVDRANSIIVVEFDTGASVRFSDPARFFHQLAVL